MPVAGTGAAPCEPGRPLSIPNLITLGRILHGADRGLGDRLRGHGRWPSCLFLVAGVSDAVDGFLAKRFHMASVLGAYLDPLADKALIVSIYLTLGINGEIPRWLVILVVSRDILIVGGIMLSWLMGSPLKIKPLVVSKLNTVAQIVFACVVLGSLGFPGRGRPRQAGADGAGGGFDPAVDRRLSRRMGAPYEFRGGTTVNAPQNRAPVPPAPGEPPARGTPFSRQLVFWLAALVAFICFCGC